LLCGFLFFQCEEFMEALYVVYRIVTVVLLITIITAVFL